MKKYLEPTIHILIWGIGYLLILNETSTIGDFKKGEGPYWIALLFGMIMNQAVFYATAFYLVPKFLRLKKRMRLILLLVLGLLIFVLFESFIDYRYLVNFFSTESEPFQVYFLYNLFVGFIILLIALSYALLKYWFQNEKQKRILLEEKLSTEMAFLKSQINPHFLFNVLNSFYAKALKNDAPELADGISKLAELMRYMVYETNEDKVALEKEIHHLKKFIQVYQLRIAKEDDVFINFKINGNIENIQISPMLLIPFVENAIKHGIDPKEKSIINITLEVTKKRITYIVTNTMHSTIYGLKENASGFGLDNLKKRLTILYPNAYFMETKEEDGYFVSLLTLQIDE